ncbi:MAG: bacillithiol biosynthesis deacetylase BshB1 [Armatimonadota bacterium]|nr:bacillithiol biosynthesis deacetylase BshB1 [Armatimonadota bacterium]MDR7452348.1 bacillithiol biosynthesis deacetylase BshB1 [Armatimonadota bacterium]MDR7466908.1 bacillithiol biosynthesis deacetylase BshB1 [Armatimonadota bacterium]MDR7493550.1 bacillithiol biosynthesis deacetylase BshB1 [Armatimonadota bacterium]MDR7498815.1 bacillithiol biosynthesis deacetylase BshB1 [Armatimonadota bacterium]
MRILAVGPHPDDVEIGMGGTVLVLRAAGHEVVLCDLTNGEPTPIGTPERRAREAAEAAGILGVRRITLEMPNRTLADTVENRQALAEVIRSVRPEILFIPYWEDAHPDHVAAAALGEAARFYAKLTKVSIPHAPWYPRRVVHFLCSHYALSVRPTFVVDISGQIDTKLRAVAAYASQFGPERGNEGFFEELRAVGRYYGALIHRAYGEPFVMREVPGLLGLDQFV